MSQPGLFDDLPDPDDGPPPAIVPGRAGGTIQERFEQFHRLNPWVYAALERLAADLVARGRTRVGIRMLWEVVRWDYTRRAVDPTSSFRVNDHYHSRYVRLLIDRHPEWGELFETRTLKA